MPRRLSAPSKARRQRAGRTLRTAVPANPMAPPEPDTREAVYLLTGPFAEFHGLICKHHLAREQTLAPDETPPVTDPYALDDPD